MKVSFFFQKGGWAVSLTERRGLGARKDWLGWFHLIDLPRESCEDKCWFVYESQTEKQVVGRGGITGIGGWKEKQATEEWRR